ncbi:hypothetical protein [Methanoculleus chikugoensis]|uniref:hypothetical protein n=1 Tax=Methanoculleus chikugoensis TaxID=118126 RepID=UPI001FB1CCF6|nr:hypothetical protein [Methanoculleus chikugoensis]
MRARKVPAAALADIADAEWVDTSRRPYVEGGIAWVPVREGYSADEDLPEREAYRGRGYHLIGDVAVVHGDAPTEEELAAIVEHCRPPRSRLGEGGVFERDAHPGRRDPLRHRRRGAAPRAGLHLLPRPDEGDVCAG